MPRSRTRATRTALREHRIVRLSAKAEDSIADLAESAAGARAEAESLEIEIGTEASAILNRFLKFGRTK